MQVYDQQRLDLPPQRTTVAAPHDPNSLYHVCKSCPKSNHCCHRATTIVALPHEAQTIIEHTGRRDLLIAQSSGLYTIRKEIGKPCPFLTPTGLCSIYEIRPTDCRSWPITLAKKINGAQYSVDSVCPAVARNELSATFLHAATDALGRVHPEMQKEYISLVHRDHEVMAFKPLYVDPFSGRPQSR